MNDQCVTLGSRKKEPVSGHWDDKEGATRMTRKKGTGMTLKSRD